MSVRFFSSDVHSAELISYFKFFCPQSTGSIGTANGSALVRLGDTTIVCGVKAEIAEPDLDRPDEGWIG